MKKENFFSFSSIIWRRIPRIEIDSLPATQSGVIRCVNTPLHANSSNCNHISHSADYPQKSPEQFPRNQRSLLLDMRQ